MGAPMCSGANSRRVDAYDPARDTWTRLPDLPLVAAFEFTPELIGAPIALGREKERQDEAMLYYRGLREAGTAPVEEKHVKAIK